MIQVAQVIHKRSAPLISRALCGAYSMTSTYREWVDKWIEWERTRYQWKYVTCKRCMAQKK